MRRFKGYMTLEASLIVPMVICVLCLLIYFAEYMYGRCIISQDSYMLAFRASVECSRQKISASEYVAGNMRNQAGKKYFGSSAPSFIGEQSGKEIKVTGTSNIKHSAMGGYFLKPKSGWGLEASFTAKQRDYSKRLRLIKRLKDIGKKE